MAQTAKLVWVIHCAKCNNHFKTEKMGHDKAANLRDTFDDNHPHKVMMKPGGKDK